MIKNTNKACLALLLLVACSSFVIAFKDSVLLTKVKEYISSWPGNETDIDSKVNYKEHYTWIPEVGVRGKYALIKNKIGIGVIEGVIGEKMFTKGPHSSEFNFASDTEFGYYNPKFLKKLQKEIVKWKKDKKFVKAFKPYYDSKLKNLCRILWLSHRYVFIEDGRTEKIQRTYLKRLKKGEKDNGFFLQEEYRDFAEAREKDGYDVYEAFVMPSFWLRRKIDKTAPLFKETLKSIIETFDEEFLHM